MSKKKRLKRKLKRKINKVKTLSKGNKQFLHNCAKKLNNNLPKSEIWFNTQMKYANLNIKDLKANKPFLSFIPDYRSDSLKLIIEIDGNYHDIPEIKKKDIEKDKLSKKAGYQVVRIKAYNDNSLLLGFRKIKEIMNK